jgi:hypothetical protein
MIQTHAIESLKEKLERYYPTQPAALLASWNNPGRRAMMTAPLASKTLKVASRVYFLDIRATDQGERYLQITEVRKGIRARIIVFAQDKDAFLTAVQEMMEKLE